MKALSIKETGLLLRLLLHVSTQSEIDIAAHGRPPLHLKKGGAVHLDQDDGYLFFLGVRLIRKREAYVYHMGFVIVDKRQSPGARGQLTVYPISYRDDVNNIQDTCCIIQQNSIHNSKPSLQINLVATATGWLRELNASGYMASPDCPSK